MMKKVHQPPSSDQSEYNLLPSFILSSKIITLFLILQVRNYFSQEYVYAHVRVYMHTCVVCVCMLVCVCLCAGVRAC